MSSENVNLTKTLQSFFIYIDNSQDCSQGCLGQLIDCYRLAALHSDLVLQVECHD